MDKGLGLGHYHVYGSDRACRPVQSAPCWSAARLGVARSGQSSVTAHFCPCTLKVTLSLTAGAVG